MTGPILKRDPCHRCPQRPHTKQMAFGNSFHHSVFDKTEHTKADISKGTSLVTEQRNMNRDCATLSDGPTCRTFQRRWYITCPMVDRTRITPHRCHSVHHASSLGTHTRKYRVLYFIPTGLQPTISFESLFTHKATKTPRRQRATSLSESFQQLRGTLNRQVILQRLKLPYIWVSKSETNKIRFIYKRPLAVFNQSSICFGIAGTVAVTNSRMIYIYIYDTWYIWYDTWLFVNRNWVDTRWQ